MELTMLKPTPSPMMTSREAHWAAHAHGIKLNLETVRRLARLNGLAIRMGHKLFIRRQGWLEFLETGQPDTLPAHLTRPTQPSA
jgi:hypothetical protein